MSTRQPTRRAVVVGIAVGGLAVAFILVAVLTGGQRGIGLGIMPAIDDGTVGDTARVEFSSPPSLSCSTSASVLGTTWYLYDTQNGTLVPAPEINSTTQSGTLHVVEVSDKPFSGFTVGGGAGTKYLTASFQSDAGHSYTALATEDSEWTPAPC